MNSIDRIEYMFEQMLNQNKLVLEAVSNMQATIKTLATKDELNEVKDIVTVIQHAVTENRHDHLALERRVTVLESKFAA